MLSFLYIVIRATLGKLTPTRRWLRSKLTGVPQVPSTPEEITAPWFTWLLQNTSVIDASVDVTRVEVAVLDVGQTSTVARVHLTFPSDKKADSFPKSLIVKMSRTDLKGRIMGLAISLYRECMFYVEFANECAMQVPRCFFADANSYTGEFVLVLEDVQPSRMVVDEAGDARAAFCQIVPDQNYGADVNAIEQALDAVTAMHFKFLNDRTILERKWIFGATSTATRKVQPEVYLAETFIPIQWKKTRESALRGAYVGAPWSEKFVAQIDDFVEHMSEAFENHYNPETPFPFTLVHGDFHTANILRVLGDNAAGRAVDSMVAIDFQLLTVDEPQADIGYIIGLSLNRADRQAHEERLVRRCFEALDPKLRAQGDNGMSWELFYARYKYYALFKCTMPLVALDSLIAEGGERDAHIAPWFMTRVQGMIEDWGDFRTLARETQALRSKAVSAAKK